jgi:hypothetical protein
MAAKKKAKAKKTGPDLSNRVLEFGDLSKKEQSNAVGMTSRVSETMPEQMATLAERGLKSPRPGMQSKGKRYAAAAPQMVSKPLSMEGMVAARKQAFHSATTGEVRLPEESIAGQEFYFQHRKELDETTGNQGLPIERVVNATSRLSIQTKPESEKAALSALTKAHTGGSVHFKPEMVEALGSQRVTVPQEFHGKEVPFKDIPGHVVQGITEPSIRETVQKHSKGVDVANMAKTSMRSNLQYAHEALQGTRSVSPTENPKLFSYGKGHELAVPDSPEHREYQLRAGHVGRVMRGQEAAGQGMFDFEGLRSSNEGVLSNRLQTPNDSWMLANERQQPQEVRKVAGDVSISTKQMKTKRGRQMAVGVGNKDITPAGIQHAVGAEATTRAAREIQTDLGLDFTVPSMMVQEGVWAAERRQANADAPFNARQRAAQPKKEKRQAVPKPLPGINWDQFKS